MVSLHDLISRRIRRYRGAAFCVRSMWTHAVPSGTWMRRALLWRLLPADETGGVGAATQHCSQPQRAQYRNRGFSGTELCQEVSAVPHPCRVQSIHASSAQLLLIMLTARTRTAVAPRFGAARRQQSAVTASTLPPILPTAVMVWLTRGSTPQKRHSGQSWGRRAVSTDHGTPVVRRCRRHSAAATGCRWTDERHARLTNAGRRAASESTRRCPSRHQSRSEPPWAAAQSGHRPPIRLRPGMFGRHVAVAL